MMFGWAGKIAFIDLTERIVRYECFSDYHPFVGGRGMGSALALDLIPPEADPLSPDNVVVLMNGPLAGTLAPGSSRLSLVFKNALTGGLGSSNVGGNFAAELKYAGVDGLIIRGRADTPTYLTVIDGRVQLRFAGHLWGRTTSQTTEIVKRELGDDRISVASIGPAGEMLSRIACVMVDGSKAAGYGGVGAVWGSKNLKAVAVGGSVPVRIANPGSFLDAARSSSDRLLAGRSISSLQRYGAVITGNGGIDGSLPQPVRNLQDGYWPPEKTLKLNALVFKEIYERHRVASVGCPIGCGRVYSFPSGGGQTEYQGLQANAVSNYGPLLDCDDAVAVLECAYLANDYGLDWDGSACAIAWAYEAFEKGILTRDDTAGLELRWGDGSTAVELIRLIAKRQGVGDLLADGSFLAAKRLGVGSEFAMHVKGAPLRETWLQIDPMWSLGIAVATRGSGHLNGAVKLRVVQSAPESVTADMQRHGLDIDFRDPSSRDMAKTVAWFENYKAVIDSLGLCYFTSWWVDPMALGPEDYASLLSAATGESVTGVSILHQGSVIHNVEKAFNTLHAGLSRRDDYLPDRIYSNQISAGPYEGAGLDRAEFDLLLDHYYQCRGYDNETGWQPPALLEGLGLSEAARRLRVAGRLGCSDSNGGEAK